jgi:ATP-dependent DNA ligase
MASPRNPKPADVQSAAVPAEALDHAFPRLNLPLQPPYPPAEAKSVKDVPREAGWLYEPKWDGFRCLAFRQGDEVVLQSKAGQPLGRYFPEIVAALLTLPSRKFVLDGEIVIRQGAGLDFDALLQRIHPAASRIQRLSQETPATYMIFDLLVDGRLFENKGRSLAARPLSARRMALQEFAAANIGAVSDRKRSKKAGSQKTLNSASERIMLSPASSDFATAEKWMSEGAASGWDGVVAKRLNCEYMSGERTGMVKIKRIRTADCVVGGFRWARGKTSEGQAADSARENSKKVDSKSAGFKKRPTEEVGSLLLGLYNKNGELDHIGFSASFTREERRKLKSILKPFMGGAGFSGKAPGGPSRWTRDARDTEWFPLKAKLVGEFQYDHFSGGRFRHGTKFLRWRPDKKPEQCTMEQIRPAKAAD